VFLAQYAEATRSTPVLAMTALGLADLAAGRPGR